MDHYDAIVIGAGHNGLTNAAFLAKAVSNAARSHAQPGHRFSRPIWRSRILSTPMVARRRSCGLASIINVS
ncbi:MAG: hypothetical protein ACE5FE_05065 [Acidiferrobacterales bacterium]